MTANVRRVCQIKKIKLQPSLYYTNALFRRHIRFLLHVTLSFFRDLFSSANVAHCLCPSKSAGYHVLNRARNASVEIKTTCSTCILYMYMYSAVLGLSCNGDVWGRRYLCARVRHVFTLRLLLRQIEARRVTYM